MAPQSSADTATFVRPTGLPGIELVSVKYQRRAFPIHSHDEYVIGSVSGGRELLSVKGQERSLQAGGVLLIEPHEPHSNRSIGECSLSYHVFYITPEAAASWIPEHLGPLIRFRSPTSCSPNLFAQVATSHAIVRSGGDPMEQQEAMAALFASIIAHGLASSEPKEYRVHTEVMRARRVIDECFVQSLSLQALAKLVNLSAFQLLRSFKRQVGLTPLAYRNQRRVEMAKALLRRGTPIAEVALEVGFVDQSHLSRHFQRIVGTSPGRYRSQ